MTLTSKLGLWILIFAMIAAIGLGLVGSKKTESSVAIEIKAPPENVFSFLTEPEKLKSWITGLTDVGELVPGERDWSGPRPITSRTMTQDGKEIRFEDEVIRYEANELLTVKSSSANQVIISIFKLEPIALDSNGSGTQVTCRVTVAHQGVGRFTAPILVSAERRQRQLDEDIRALKERIESSN